MIEEPDRSRIDRAMFAYQVFNFAYKAVCLGLDRSLTDDEGMRIWKAVEEVAAGDATLNISAAEMNQASATTAAGREHNARYVNEQMRREREIAEMLVNAREGFVHRKAGD